MEKLLVSWQFTLFTSLYGTGPLPPYELLCFSISTMFANVSWLWIASEVSQQPPRVMGTYTYWHVAGNTETLLKNILDLIYRFNHYKMENVQKIGHLELLQWWFLQPSVYIYEQRLLFVPSKLIREIPCIMEHKTPQISKDTISYDSERWW